MVKGYPLEVENVGGDTYIVMSKGHHDLDEFMKAVQESWDWPLGKPEHVWIKSTPNNIDGGTIFHVVEESVRGSFPATYSWEAYGDDRYKTPDNKVTVAGREYTVVNSAEFIVKNGYNGYKQAKVVNGVKTPSGEAVVVNKDGSWVFANPTFQI